MPLGSYGSPRWGFADPPERAIINDEHQTKEVKRNGKRKKHVFSVRMTEEGLKTLNELMARLNVGWDDLVVDVMCGYYELDKAVMSLPKKEVPAKKHDKK